MSGTNIKFIWGSNFSQFAKEEEEAMNKIKNGEKCWYCDCEHCNLTHKYDPLEHAKYPKLTPYPNWWYVRMNIKNNKHISP
jgi:hypothetical protein